MFVKSKPTNNPLDQVKIGLKFVRTAGARNKFVLSSLKKEAETKKDTIEDGKKILKR